MDEAGEPDYRLRASMLRSSLISSSGSPAPSLQASIDSRDKLSLRFIHPLGFFSSMDGDDDSDIPEEITIQQGIKQDEEIRKVQRDSKKRVASEGKERRRKWAQRKTQRQLKDGAVAPKTLQSELHQDEHDETPEDTHGMLPKNIVNLLAIREKKIFHSDSENETADDKPSLKKKKQKRTGSNVMILKELPPAHCLQNSAEFLKKRKMNVQRSDTVLKNSKQALRLLSSRGLCK